MLRNNSLVTLVTENAGTFCKPTTAVNCNTVVIVIIIIIIIFANYVVLKITHLHEYNLVYPGSINALAAAGFYGRLICNSVCSLSR